MPGPHPCLPRPPRPPPRDRSPPDGGKRWRRGGVQTAPARPCPTFFPSLPRKADRCPFLPQCRPPPAWTGATAAAGRAMRGGGEGAKARWEEEERRTCRAPCGPWTRAGAARCSSGNRAPPCASARRPAREPAAPPSGALVCRCQRAAPSPLLYHTVVALILDKPDMARFFFSTVRTEQ